MADQNKTDRDDPDVAAPLVDLIDAAAGEEVPPRLRELALQLEAALVRRRSDETSH